MLLKRDHDYPYLNFIHLLVVYTNLCKYMRIMLVNICIVLYRHGVELFPDSSYLSSVKTLCMLQYVNNSLRGLQISGASIKLLLLRKNT